MENKNLLCAENYVPFFKATSPRQFFSVYIVISALLFKLFLNYFYEKYNISKSNISEKIEN